MGKYRNDLSSRLSGFKNNKYNTASTLSVSLNNQKSFKTIKQQHHSESRINPRINESRLRFKHQKPHSTHEPFDARHLLTSRSKTTTKTEPLIIVTGLGNVRRDGESLVRIVNNNTNNKRHQVITNGSKTFVTLTNDLAKEKREKDRDYERMEIRIRNDSATNRNNRNRSSTPSPPPSRLTVTSVTPQPQATSVMIEPTQMLFHHHLNQSSMQIQESQINSKSTFSRNSGGSMYSSSISSNSNNSHNNHVDSSSSYQNGASRVLLSANKEGYKLLVSNLHERVSEDDVSELFSDIGPIKRARFIDKGLAEVTYVRLEHAREAIEKYDQSTLDGRPMVIGFADKNIVNEERQRKQQLQKQQQQHQMFTPMDTSSNGVLPPASLNARSSYIENVSSSSSSMNALIASKDTLSNKFKSITGSKDSNSFIQLPESKRYDINNPRVDVDNSIIHQVLFNKKPTLNPVTFTVKL